MERGSRNRSSSAGSEKMEPEACNTDTTPTKSHRNSNTHRTKKNTISVVIQRNSRKLLMMDILMSGTCWAHKKWNKIASYIKLVFYSSTITMIHGTININAHHYLVFYGLHSFKFRQLLELTGKWEKFFWTYHCPHTAINTYRTL